MRRNDINDIQVRGCCCGIPFGCGTVLLLTAGAALWQYAGTLWAVFTAAVGG